MRFVNPEGSRKDAIATILRSNTAIMGMKTFHCQRIPVAQRTTGGKFMGVSNQRRDWCASERVTEIVGGSGVARQRQNCSGRFMARGFVFLLQSGAHEGWTCVVSMIDSTVRGGCCGCC